MSDQNSEQIAVRLSKRLLKRVEAYLEERKSELPEGFKLKRSDAVRILLIGALNQHDRSKTAKTL